MALNHSPKIVTDGLVFAYDMANTWKSWKGAPTTNYFYYSEDFTNAQWTKENSITITANSAVAPDGTNTANLVTFPTGTLPRFYQTRSELGGQNAVLSVWIKSATGSNQSVELWLRQSGFGTTYTSGSFTATPFWQRVYVTAAIPAGVSAMGMFYQSNAGSATNTVYMWGGQLEAGTFPSGYVKSVASYGTRSNTQALVDLTGQNTITATSLTYASDGTFSFNGSSNYATFPENSAFNTQTPTVEVWVKTNATSQNGFWFEKGTVNSQYALFQEGANITWRHTTNVGSLVAPAASYINTSQYAQIVGTYTAGDRRIYVNGVQVASDTLNYTLPTNANGCSIGVYGGATGARGYWYNGNIASVKVYNRALSAAEVKQNFNALRGRYGI